jgi:DNA replication protein DnaC
VSTPGRKLSTSGSTASASPSAPGASTTSLERLGRVPLIVDEVGYIPFDPEAAAVFFALISSR